MAALTMTIISMAKRIFRTGTLFVDTSAFIALLWRGDRWHKDAASFYRNITGRPKITSNLVVAETYGRLRYGASYDFAVRFLRGLREAQDQGSISLVRSDEALEQKAEKLLAQFQDQDISYVDAVSFAIIRDLLINDVFCFDKHFYLLGCNVLPGFTE